MSLFRVSITIADPRGKEAPSDAIDALVDTGSELTRLPQSFLENVGIKPIKSMNFKTAAGELVRRNVGYAIVRCEEFETIDQVAFGQGGDHNLLGVRTLEGFSVMVDNLGKRLVATTSLVASTPESSL